MNTGYRQLSLQFPFHLIVCQQNNSGSLLHWLRPLFPFRVMGRLYVLIAGSFLAGFLVACTSSTPTSPSPHRLRRALEAFSLIPDAKVRMGELEAPFAAKEHDVGSEGEIKNTVNGHYNPAGGRGAVASQITEEVYKVTTENSEPTIEHVRLVPRYITLAEESERPARVVLPDNYPADQSEDGSEDQAGAKLWPLIMMLHGYGSDASYHDHFLGLSARINQHGGFLALLPNGTVNSEGKHFWNGIRCCDFDHQGPDDVTYLTSLVKEAIRTLDVDPRRVYMLGHSNGGAMTQILACEHGELFAAIASVTPGEIPSVCAPSHPISVLEVCASEDVIVKADLCASVVGNWTTVDRCPAAPHLETSRDYDCDPSRPFDDNEGYDQWRDHNCKQEGRETEVTGWVCKGGSQVEFWWMRGAAHNPALSPQWSDDVVAWLLSKDYVAADS